MDCSLTGSSVHGISQATILGWVAISFSRGSSWARDQGLSPALAGRFFTAEPSGKPLPRLLNKWNLSAATPPCATYLIVVKVWVCVCLGEGLAKKPGPRAQYHMLVWLYWKYIRMFIIHYFYFSGKIISCFRMDSYFVQLVYGHKTLGSYL